MALVLQAIRYMIWLQAGVAALFIGLGVAGVVPNAEPFVLMSFATIGVLLIARLGAQREWVWVMIPFAVLCVVSVFSGMRGGIELFNLPYLADAVLSAIALVGLNDWRRDRKRLRPAKVRSDADADEGL